MSQSQQRGMPSETRPPNGWVRTSLIMGAAAAIGVSVIAAQLTLTASRVNAGILDPAFCSPGSLHTTVELPETQLTRDFMAIRILLKDPAGSLDTIRKLYEGEL